MKTISIKDFKKEKKKTPNYIERYNKAIQNGFNNNHLDEIKTENESIFLFLNDVIILSNNDLLRIHYRKSYQYRELWKNRIINLIKKKNIKQKNKITIEVLYIKRKNKILDYDASISCLKYIIDGIVKSEIIKDDTIKEIPLINTRTIYKKELEKDRLIVHIKEIKEENEIDDFYSEKFNELYKKEL